MSLKAKTSYQLVCSVGQEHADKLDKIIKWCDIKNNSVAIRFCIDQTFKVIEPRAPTR